MAKPFLILVPAYRCESTIAETLVSIQQQGKSLEQIREVVIAEDGSQDRTAEVARSVWKSPIPLHILERRYNCGEYASINSAVDQFPPDIEWFLIMHADNLAKPGWLDTILLRIASAGAQVGLIGSSYDRFDDAGHIWPGENEATDKIVIVPGTRKAVADTLRMGCWWHISSCAIRVDTFKQVGGLPKMMQWRGDWDFMLRVLAGGWSILHIPRSLMRYRRNPKGSSSIVFQRHHDIWESMTVVKSFACALSGRELLSIHGRSAWNLVRRIGGCAVRRDLERLFWALPALSCVAVSYQECLANRKASPAKR